MSDLEKKYGPNFSLKKESDKLFWTRTFQAYKIVWSQINPQTVPELLDEPVFKTLCKAWPQKEIYCITHFLRLKMIACSLFGNLVLDMMCVLLYLIFIAVQCQ